MSDPRADDRVGEGGPHLEAEDVAAYVDGSLPEERRSRLEVHLADCDPCREEVVAVRRSVKGADGRRSPGPGGRVPRWAPVAAAAGLAGLLLVGTLLEGPSGTDEPVFRDGPASLQEEGVPRITVVRPVDGGTVVHDSLRFVWRAAGPDASYRFTLTDATGDVLWRAETPDTALVLGPEVALRSDEEYYWYVDTLLETGASATTDVVRFRVRSGAP
ncbi:MAG TPA: zf-HC2 domain-containing protein [Longimicrobiales bacterium]|nr:zf-HC2 domain-containing protein [Longimicrobiales bacterium]